MFKRSNLVAKYRVYAKTLKALQDKATAECSTKLGNKYDKLSGSYKVLQNIVEQSKSLAAQNKVLSIAHSKLNAGVEKSKEKCANITQTLKNNRFLATPGLCAAAFIKSDPVTISGYSQNDVDILKQLGIVVGDNNANSYSNNINASTENSSSAAQEAIPNNVPDSDSLLVATNESASANNYDFPPSLFDTQNNYTSIFDNMPQERNDLYTTITNTFKFSDEKSTQVSSHDLQPTIEATNSEQNTFTNDFFVIETPGAQPVSVSDANDARPTDSINDNAFVASDVGDGELLGAEELTATNIGDAVNSTRVENVDIGAEALLASDVNTNIQQSIDNVVVEPIPEPPALPDLAAEAASQVNALGEATFASLGLGGWTPVGIVQNCFEYLHVSLGIPWWEAIVLGTLVIRFAMFPLVIMSQKNAAKMNNHLPQMQVIQLKMTEARQSGNQMEVARYSQELVTFMKEKNLNPLKNMIVPLAQMPIFVSFFMGLRSMANVPVDSLRTGGLFWFTDLTVPDQFFALPFITSLTLWATIELGTDSARLSSQNLQTMKYVLRAMPWVILPFTVNFPGAILCYWVASNFISLGQVGFLKIPAVRDYFHIDPMLKHDPTKLPIKNKGFVGGLKDSWTNIKITKEIEERRRLDDLQFQRAGKGPLVKTYKYDPTKQVKKTSTAKSAIKSSS